MRKWQEYLHNPKNTFKGKKYMFICVNCLYIPYVKHTHTHIHVHAHRHRDNLIYYFENNLYRKLKSKGMKIMNVFVNMEFKECRNSDKTF